MAGDNASVGRSNFKKPLNNLVVHVHHVNEDDCDDLIRLYSQFIDEVASVLCFLKLQPIQRHARHIFA